MHELRTLAVRNEFRERLSWRLRGSFTGNTSRIYTNGVLVATGPAAQPLSALNDDNNVWLGRSQFNTDPNFAGKYDELRIYKGDYENYLEKKAARIESDVASVDKARNIYRDELEWMRKQPRARTTKSKSRQDNFYEVEKKARQRTPPHPDPLPIR